MINNIKLRYPIGITALVIVGFLGGDIFWTSVEFGATFAVLDWVFERG
jgi:hypothetical protein|tara:strand:- start:173 stop:316 length:144 start_codon:yes stop_codon:yes gene_type:complete